MTEVASIPPEKIIQIGPAFFHLRYADLLRPLTDGERTGLRDSIQKYGIRQAVTVAMLPKPDGEAPGSLHYEVLDGAHRVEEAAALGFDLTRVPTDRVPAHMTPEDKRALAISLNFDRRHMGLEERRQRAAELRAQGQSYRQIGEALGVDPMTARKDVKRAEEKGVDVSTPATVTGKDGKSYPAVEAEPPEQMIEFARALIPAALLTWTKPVEAGHIARQIRKDPGAEHIAVKAVKTALGRMVEAGNVVKLKNDAGHTVYALAHDPAIENTPQAGESPAPEETPAPATTPEAVKRAILEALADGPRDLIALRNTGWLADVPPAQFAGYTVELINAGSIRRDAARPYEVFELVPDTAAQSAAWLDQQVSKQAPAEQAQTQTAKDAARITDLLAKQGLPLRMKYIRDTLDLTEERFTRARMLLTAGGGVTQEGESLRLVAPVEPEPNPTAAEVDAANGFSEESALPYGAPENGNGMSIHYSSESAEWYTPADVVERTIAALTGIDLDPCSNSHESPNVPAAMHYTKEDDGLAQEWAGKVYMNPPYGREISQWVEKLVTEFRAGRVTQAIALVPARTDTAWFQALRDFPRCFISGRLKFLTPEGKETDPAPFPSMAVYLGPDLDRFAEHFASLGDIYVRYTPKG